MTQIFKPLESSVDIGTDVVESNGVHRVYVSAPGVLYSDNTDTSAGSFEGVTNGASTAAGDTTLIVDGVTLIGTPEPTGNLRISHSDSTSNDLTYLSFTESSGEYTFTINNDVNSEWADGDSVAIITSFTATFPDTGIATKLAIGTYFMDLTDNYNGDGSITGTIEKVEVPTMETPDVAVTFPSSIDANITNTNLDVTASNTGFEVTNTPTIANTGFEVTNTPDVVVTNASDIGVEINNNVEGAIDVTVTNVPEVRISNDEDSPVPVQVGRVDANNKIRYR